MHDSIKSLYTFFRRASLGNCNKESEEKKPAVITPKSRAKRYSYAVFLMMRKMVLSYKKCIVKEPVFFDELLLCGGERGIRTPVTVFAVNMISNHAPSTARTPLHVCSLTYRSAPY